MVEIQSHRCHHDLQGCDSQLEATLKCILCQKEAALVHKEARQHLKQANIQSPNAIAP